MALLTVTKNYQDGDVLLEADLDAMKSSIETFINVTRLNDDNLQDDGITGSDKLVDASVSQAKLASNSVATAKIVDSAVTTAKILDSNVTTAKIADSNVTTAKIADSNITTAKIADANVTAVKLATGSVTEDKLGSGAVTETKIGSNAVTTAKIADDAVTLAKMSSTAYISEDYSGSASGTTTLTLISGMTVTAPAGRPIKITITRFEASVTSTIAIGASAGSRVLRFGSGGRALMTMPTSYSHTFGTNAGGGNDPWVFVIASPGAGSHDLYIDASGSNSITVTRVSILIEELP